MSPEQRDRMQTFKDIEQRRAQRHNAPTLFNPHYDIKPTVIRSRDVSTQTGPSMMSQQWERTGRRRP